MQLPRRSVRSIQELPSIYTVFPGQYRAVRTHSASTSSESARSPDIEDGLEVVPLEHQSALSAPIVSGYLDEKEVYIAQQEVHEKPLPNVPVPIWKRAWGRMSVKYRVLTILGLLAVVLLTVGIALLASPKRAHDNHPESRRTGDNVTNTVTTSSIDRGTFVVPILSPQQQSSKCLARANESRAWQCAFDTVLQLSVLPSLSEDAEGSIMVTLGLPSNTNSSIHCGQQAPEIGPTALTALNGSSDGPQYHFSAIYNRVVILREDQLGQENPGSSPMQGQTSHITFPPGESLWRCTFNDTRLEGFIYAGKDKSTTSNITSSAMVASQQLPYSLKLLEQRPATGSAPYCERVVVGVDGSLEGDSDGVDLEFADAGSSSSQDDTSCQCQWVVE